MESTAALGADTKVSARATAAAWQHHTATTASLTEEWFFSAANIKHHPGYRQQRRKHPATIEDCAGYTAATQQPQSTVLIPDQSPMTAEPAAQQQPQASARSRKPATRAPISDRVSIRPAHITHAGCTACRHAQTKNTASALA